MLGKYKGLHEQIIKRSERETTRKEEEKNHRRKKQKL